MSCANLVELLLGSRVSGREGTYTQTWVEERDRHAPDRNQLRTLYLQELQPTAFDRHQEHLALWAVVLPARSPARTRHYRRGRRDLPSLRRTPSPRHLFVQTRIPNSLRPRMHNHLTDSTRKQRRGRRARGRVRKGRERDFFDLDFGFVRPRSH